MRADNVSPKPKFWILHLLLIILAFFMLVPFVWMILTSFKSLGESMQVPVIVFPGTIHWRNYIEVLYTMPFSTFYFNTIAITALKVLGTLTLSSLAAYAFARIEFPGRNVLFVILISVLMVPGQIYILPLFLIMRDFGWLNSLQAVAVPGMFDAFGVFLLRQFFLSLMKELEESAKLDGCNHLQIYWRIMLPLTKPGLIALTIFTVLASWNELLWPMVVNSSPAKMTLAVGLSWLQGRHGTNYPVLMAGSLMALWPMVLLFLTLQRHFIEGIAMTGTK